MREKRTIRWTASMSVADEVLDREHRELVDVINLIGEAQASGNSERQVVLLNQLLNVAREHFSNEEALLRGVGYPELQQHELEHRRFMDQLVTLSGIGEVSPRVLQLLNEWIIEHLFEHDRCYVSFLKERARSTDGGDDTGS